MVFRFPYQIHRAIPDIPIDEMLRAPDDLVRSGKVRYIAVRAPSRRGSPSRRSGSPIVSGSIALSVNSLRTIFSNVIFPWSPLGGGLLTGKYKRGSKAPSSSRFAEVEKNVNLRSRFNDGVYAITEGLLPLAEKKTQPFRNSHSPG